MDLDTQANPSLRQRHADRTRTSIITAALELFDEHGFAAATVDDIAARADIAPRTFYRYFPTKEAVLYHDTDQIVESIRDQLLARPDDEPPHRSLLIVCLELGNELAADTARMQLLQRLSRDDPALIDYQRLVLLQQFEHVVVETLATRQHLDTSDIELRATTAALLSSLAIAFRTWINSGAHGSIAPSVNQALNACRHAFNDNV
jgi:AcrR family transcriptional regulator